MKHILIIEDDISIAELERDYLEANGITSEIVMNGELGLQKALHQDYDLILLMLCCREWMVFPFAVQCENKKMFQFFYWFQPVREDVDKIRGLGLGADDYISNPFQPFQLVARVKAHMNRYERLTTSGVSNHGPVFTVGDLQRFIWIQDV